MKKIILVFSSLMFLSLIFISNNHTLAATSTNPQEAAINQLKAAAGASGVNIGTSQQTDLRILIAVTIRSLLGFIGIIFIVMIVYAGFLWMTAGGEEDKISTAKKLIYNGVIGLAIILCAYSITYFIFKLVLGAAAPSANPFGYGSTSNFTNYGSNPSDYSWYTGR